MEHQTQQGQKFATLLLASSILIAGLFIGGAILTKGGVSDSVPSTNTNEQRTGQLPQRPAGQVPSCGV